MFSLRSSGKASVGRGEKYPPLANKGAPKPVKTFEEFKTRVMPMLAEMGPYGYTDPILLYKISRILKAALQIVRHSFTVRSDRR